MIAQGHRAMDPPVRLSLGADARITALAIDRHELRFGGQALARLVLDAHAQAYAEAQRARRRELAALGVPESVLARLDAAAGHLPRTLTVDPPDTVSARAPLAAMSRFLDAVTATIGTGRAHVDGDLRTGRMDASTAGGSVHATVSVHGQLLGLSLPSTLRAVAPAALSTAVIAACAEAAADAAQCLESLRQQLGSSLTDR